MIKQTFILPGSSNVEPFLTIRFHLWEIQVGMRTLSKEVKNIMPVIPTKSHKNYKIWIRGIVDAIGSIEHDLSWHLAQTLELLGTSLDRSQLLSRSDRLSKIEADFDEGNIDLHLAEKMAREMDWQAAMLEIDVDVERSRERATHIAGLQWQDQERSNFQQLERELLAFADLLEKSILPKLERIHKQGVWAYEAINRKTYEEAFREVEKNLERSLTTGEREELYHEIKGKGYCFWSIVVEGVEKFGTIEHLEKIPKSMVPAGWEWW